MRPNSPPSSRVVVLKPANEVARVAGCKHTPKLARRRGLRRNWLPLTSSLCRPCGIAAGSTKAADSSPAPAAPASAIASDIARTNNPSCLVPGRLLPVYWYYGYMYRYRLLYQVALYMYLQYQEKLGRRSSYVDSCTGSGLLCQRQSPVAPRAWPRRRRNRGCLRST